MLAATGPGKEKPGSEKNQANSSKILVKYLYFFMVFFFFPPHLCGPWILACSLHCDAGRFSIYAKWLIEKGHHDQINVCIWKYWKYLIFLFFHNSDMRSKHTSKWLLAIPTLFCDLFSKYTIYCWFRTTLHAMSARHWQEKENKVSNPDVSQNALINSRF